MLACNLKRLLLSFLIVLCFVLPGQTATYYVRADGTAPNKAAAIGPTTDASKCMSFATHNGETFSPGDCLDISDQGSDYTSKLWPPSSGSSGNPIIYRAATGESPVIDMTGQADHCATCYGLSYITFTNLMFTGGDINKYGIVLSNAHDISIDTCVFNNNYRGIGWGQLNADVYNISIENCSIYSNDECGIWWNSGATGADTGKTYNVSILNNSIYDNALHGIRCNSVDPSAGSTDLSSAITISENRIYGNDRYGISLTDIDNDQGTSLISNNIVYNNGDNPGANPANGIWIGGGSHITIEYNEVYNNNTGDIDGVGIMLDFRSGFSIYANNCIVRYNLCYNHDSCNDQVPWHGSDSAFNSSGIGICCGAHDNEVYYNICHGNAVGISLGGASGVTTADNKIYNNTLVNNRLGIQIDLQNAGSTGNDIQNNIIAHNTMGVLTNYGMYIDATTVVTSGNITIDYNAWYDNDTDFSDNSGQSWSQGSHKVETDPKILSIAAGNFKIGPKSSCIDAGTDLTLTQDFRGRSVPKNNFVDIGAYESIKNLQLNAGQLIPVYAP